MYKVDVTPVVGLPQFSGWSQVTSSYSPAGQLVCAFSVQGDHAGNVGRDLTTQISQAQVRSAVDVHQFVTQFLAAAEQLDVQLQLATGFFSSAQAVFTVKGGSVFLKRGLRAGVLLNSPSKLRLIEGKRQTGDIAVLITQQAQGFVSEIEQKFESGFETDSVVTSIIPGLHGLEDSSLSSIAFVIGGRNYAQSELEVKQKLDLEPSNTESEFDTEPEKLKISEAEIAKHELAESALDLSPELEPEPKQHQKKKQALPQDTISAPTPTPASTRAPLVPALVPAPALAPASAADGESLLNIPPALKLRGAGRKRSTLLPTKSPSLDPTLSQLGKSGQPTRSSQWVSQLLTFLNQGLKTVASGARQVDWRSLQAKLVQWLSWLKQWGIKVFKLVQRAGRRFTSKDVYLQVRQPHLWLRRVLLIVGGLILIGEIIVFNWSRIQRQVRSAEEAVAPLTEQLAIAREQAETEPILARNSVDQIIAQLEQLADSYADHQRAAKKVAQQLVAAREFYDQISGQEEFAQLEIFYDLRLVDDEFVTSAVDATAKQAVFLDQGQKRLVVLNLDTKQAEKIELTDFEQLTDLELTNSTLSLLAQGVKQQDLSVDESASEVIEVIPEGDSNRAASFIEAFASYIYVFNPEKRNIYRYVQQEEGYSDPVGWVSGAVGFDYDQASSWAVDGEIWVATREGGLHRLTSGREQVFEINGLSQNFEHSLQVFTHEDLQNLYVLEPNAHRLVILTKKGEFLKEINSESLASTTTLFASEELGKVFAVSGSIIYAVEL